MSFKSINLKRAYSSDSDDIVNDFYIPVLENAVEYKRLAGFFSSTSLAIAAKGILGLIKSGGIYKLIVSAKLSKQDVDILLNSRKRPEEIIEERMMNELTHLEDEFVRDHVYALGWMVANKKLDIKVATVHSTEGEILNYEDVERSSLFHQKVGVLVDKERNVIAFSGSVNETAKGWLENIEEFKVFRSWEQTEYKYIEIDTEKFDRFWNNKSLRVRTIDVPEAVEKKLIDIAPSDITTYDLKKWHKKPKRTQKIELYTHQKDAVKAWLQHDKRGIFEMATGTGKTFAALGCLSQTFRESSQMVAVIACPYHHLITQWTTAIRKFGVPYNQIIADSSNTDWRHQLTDCMFDLKNEVSNKLIILTTHATFPSEDFINILRISKIELLLIVDEVHGIGAPKRIQGLVDEYSHRLGLSATPKRWFDIEGTNRIYDYFGDTVYEFTLKDAIHKKNPATGEPYLVQYEYKPYFVELNQEEMTKYIAESRRIAKAYHNASDDINKEEQFSLLCIRRQKIIKNAENKYLALNKILNEIGYISHCLIYCSEKQIDKVQDILNTRNVNQHKFTEQEKMTASAMYGGISEREFLLKKFGEGKYQALVAIKCLDEGVDVPPARTAILMSSTGNPREYIQRRGRILRRAPDKNKAVIYDVIVVPPIDRIRDTMLRELERKILKKEMIRYKEFAELALNALECLNNIYPIEERYKI